MRRRYDREFKIVAELESGKALAQIASEHGIHPGFPLRRPSVADILLLPGA